MLASRLFRIATDIVGEFDNFKIPDMQREVLSLTQRAHSLTDHQYRTEASQILSRVSEIINNTVLKKYPQYLKKLLSESEYARAAPARVAHLLASALPKSKANVMPSPELASLLQPIDARITQLRSLTQVARAFHIEPIVIQEGILGIDLIFPETVFDGDAKQSLKIQAAFVDAAGYFIELCSGSAQSPALIYTSTGSLIVGIGLLTTAGLGLLKLYDSLLNVALKQVQLLQAIKTLRGVNPSGPDLKSFESAIAQTLKVGVEEAVSSAVNSLAVKTDAQRRNEIEGGLNIAATAMLDAIKGGARISITIESLGDIQKLTESADIQLEKAIDESIADRRLLEKKLDTQMDLFRSMESPLLIDSKSGNDETTGEGAQDAAQ